MNIVFSSSADIPLYQQIVDQISAQIIKGELASGFSLPPIRTVAKELRISVITVKRAWEELERDGLIQTMAGKGCYVASMQSRDLDSKRLGLISEKLIKDIVYYKSLGLAKAELIDLIEQNF